MSRPPGRPRAVFDCNTLVQAIGFERGPSAACVQLVEAGVVELFLSRATFGELQRVLAYKQVRAISANMTSVRIGAFLQRLRFRATLVRRVPHVFEYPRDPHDEPYVDLSVAARADYLVTRDNDLLSLMTGHSTLCKQFRHQTRPLRVIDPPAFLRALDHPIPPPSVP